MSKPRNKKNTARPAARPAPAPVVNQSTQRTPEQAQGNGNIIVLAAVGATVLLFWYFHLLVLNQMSDLSGGLAMPDQMMGGYSVADIATQLHLAEGTVRNYLSNTMQKTQTRTRHEAARYAREHDWL